MFKIGIDVGSAYTKYCVARGDKITELYAEKTPVRQSGYFAEKIADLAGTYPISQIVSCGYGRENVLGATVINELTALCKGVYQIIGEENASILDIGGQDIKVVTQIKGKLRDFFLSDKCAAGSGMFLDTALNMLGRDYDDIDLTTDGYGPTQLSSVCAVFAQSEIVSLIAGNTDEERIIRGVIRHIFLKAKPLLIKTDAPAYLLTGGLSQIKGICRFAKDVTGFNFHTFDNAAYAAAIGCAFSQE